MNGLLLVNKPVGITSFDVIRKLRRSTGVRKIGHAGTLDPLASGLMLILFGTACKQAQQLTKLDKSYEATVRLGATSTTDDDEGEKVAVSEHVPTLAEVGSAVAKLSGEIIQVPSAYSAIKIDGKEAYKRVRAGEQVTMPSRTVQVYKNQLESYEYPMVRLNLEVSSGTYVRTIARELGNALGTGAYLAGLTRTSIGQYDLGQAIALASTDDESVAPRLLTLK